MVMCWVPSCNHYTERKICRFFRFPKDEPIRKKWISQIKCTNKEPGPNAMVCSCHFVDGDKNNSPTVFEVKESVFKYRTPEKIKQRKSGTPTKPATQTTQPAAIRQELFPEAQSSVSLDAPSASTSCDTPAANDSCGTSPLLQDFRALNLQNINTSGSALDQAEAYFLRKENDELKLKLQKLEMAFSFEHIKDNDELIHMYTGIPNKYLFDTLYGLFENIPLKYYAGWVVYQIPKRDQLLMTLMRLRRGFLQSDLACRFGTSTATLSNIVRTWVCALHEILFCQFMKEIPSRHKNKTCMPACFSVFSNCRIVLDCTEMKYVKPKSLGHQKLTYSSYKHNNTLKGLVGVAPNGVITFMSELYPGSVSDKKIVEDCGILNKMEVGDLIIADKGFLIKDLLPAGVDLNLPPFLTTPQFTPEQAIQTRTIARARIHVERAIRRIKCYSILNSIPSSLVTQATMIFQVCGALTNFQFPLIAEVENLYEHTNQ